MAFRKSSYSSDSSNCVEVWQKSSYCDGGACVEIAKENSMPNPQWFKSSKSAPAGGECVEAAFCNCPKGVVLVRDSKDVTGPVLSFSKLAWQDFIGAIKNEHFEA